MRSFMVDDVKYLSFFDLKYKYFSEIIVFWKKKKESDIMYAHELIDKVENGEITLKYLEKNALISLYDK